MTEPLETTNESITVLDVYDFLQQGWKILLACCLLGGGVGIGTAFLWPEKYEANALIQTGRMPVDEPGGLESNGREVRSREIDTPAVLADKMRSPTYFSAKTLEVCKMMGYQDPARELVAMLSPKVPRQSTFVSVNFRAADTRAATTCLEAVLSDVKSNQQEIAAVQTDLVRTRLAEDIKKLQAAEDFLSNLGAKSTDTAAFVAALHLKRVEITELKKTIRESESALAFPQTRPASFATPIYAPAQRVEPKRSLVVLACTVAGLGLGFFWLLSLRAVRALKRQLVQR